MLYMCNRQYMYGIMGEKHLVVQKKYSWPNTHTYTHIRAPTHTHMHTHVHAHAHTRTRTRTHIHTMDITI